MEYTEKKIILIGPVTNVPAGLIGGATISFGYLINYLDRASINYWLVNTQKYPRGFQRYLNPFYILIKVLQHALYADVIFLNSSRGGTKYLAPLLFVIAKVFQLKFVFRPFGGDIKDYTSHYSNFQKWLFRKTVLRSDIFFLQTKELMRFYSNKANTVFLPTCRETASPDLLSGERPFTKRFIYLGFINQAKGIDHLLEASRQLTEDYVIHIYGPIKEAPYHQHFEANPGMYQGVLAKEEVMTTLRNYDVLILPTFYEGEGYPGSIIEAYSIGIPVITTQWKAIPEVVIHGQTGLLIAPHSTDALVKAILHFDTNNYKDYAKNASEYFSASFNSNQVIGRAMKQIKNLFPSAKRVKQQI